MSPSTLLKIGDRVRFKLDDSLGTVTDVNWAGAQITWDDGVVSTTATRDLEALAEVLAKEGA